MTRLLSLQDVAEYDCIEGQMMRTVRNEMTKDFFSDELEHITLLDDRYFLISGEDAKAMKWPHDVMHDFTGVAGEKQKLEEKQVKMLKEYKSNVVEGMEENDDTKHYIALEENQFGSHLRLHYGKDAF